MYLCSSSHWRQKWPYGMEKNVTEGQSMAIWLYSRISLFFPIQTHIHKIHNNKYVFSRLLLHLCHETERKDVLDHKRALQFYCIIVLKSSQRTNELNSFSLKKYLNSYKFVHKLFVCMLFLFYFSNNEIPKLFL